jgi:hypothetical protein
VEADVTVPELLQRFPEIPRDLHREPALARLAAACSALLERARKPSACSTQHDAGNHFYLKLIGPLAIHGYGLSSKEKVLSQIEDLLARQARDPERFAASLLPEGVVEQEVRGPGCA